MTARRRCGSTAATANTSSSTPPPSASTSKSPNVHPGQGFHTDPEALDRRADLRLAHAPPPLGPRLRDPSGPLGSMIHLAMVDLMARRLTGENTVSWQLYGHIKQTKNRSKFLEFCRYLRSLHPVKKRIAIVCDNPAM